MNEALKTELVKTLESYNTKRIVIGIEKYNNIIEAEFKDWKTLKRVLKFFNEKRDLLLEKKEIFLI